MVIFPDSLKGRVGWDITGSTGKVNATLNGITNVVTFRIGSDPNYLGPEAFKVTATNLDNNNSAERNMTGRVKQGDEPILGDLENITLISGMVDSTILLNPYVRDADTPVDSMRWEVLGNTNVIIDESRLGKGKDHKLILSSKPGFIGEETLIIKVYDPINYFDADTIVVKVISLTRLNIYVFPNPIAGEFVNFVIYSSDSLISVPTFDITIDDDVYERELVKIPNIYAWKADFQFPTDVSGTESLGAVAVDRFEKTINDYK